MYDKTMGYEPSFSVLAYDALAKFMNYILEI